jgi:hypothetical protein
MKRRTLQRIRAEDQPERHHIVYVVSLDPAAKKLPSARELTFRVSRIVCSQSEKL